MCSSVEFKADIAKAKELFTEEELEEIKREARVSAKQQVNKLVNDQVRKRYVRKMLKEMYTEMYKEEMLPVAMDVVEPMVARIMDIENVASPES